jgi:hypothetical protein
VQSSESHIHFTKSPLFIASALAAIFVIVALYTHNPKISFAGDNASYFNLGTALSDGAGYTNIFSPTPAPATHFPPGYPAIIAGAMTLFSADVAGIKLLNYFFLAAALLLVFFLSRHLLKSTQLAIITTVLCIFNPASLEFAGQMMSEIPFLFFTMLALWSFVKSENNEAKFYANPWFWIMVFSVVISLYIRSIGIALFGGIAAVYVSRLRFIPMLSFCILVVGMILPWQLRNTGLGGNSYLNQLVMLNPLKPEAGYAGLGDWATRIGANFERYVTLDIPAAIFPFGQYEYSEDSTPLQWISGFLILWLAVFGLLQLKHGKRIFVVYFAATFFILLLWPPVWYGPRFLLPLVPIILLGMCRGVGALIEFVQTRMKWSSKVWQAYLPLGLLLLMLPGIFHLNWESRQPYPKQQAHFIKIAELTQLNTPENTVVITRKPALFYLFSKRKSLNYKYTLDYDEQLDFFRDNNVSYVLHDNLGYRSIGRYLTPALKANEHYFSVELILSDPETILFKFDREK